MDDYLQVATILEASTSTAEDYHTAIQEAFEENKRIARSVRVRLLLSVPCISRAHRRLASTAGRTEILESTTSLLAYPKLSFVSSLQKDLEISHQHLVWNVAVNDLPLSGDGDAPLQTFPQLKPGRPRRSR